MLLKEIFNLKKAKDAIAHKLGRKIGPKDLVPGAKFHVTKTGPFGLVEFDLEVISVDSDFPDGRYPDVTYTMTSDDHKSRGPSTKPFSQVLDILNFSDSVDKIN